jgi:hypothetical protein
LIEFLIACFFGRGGGGKNLEFLSKSDRI